MRILSWMRLMSFGAKRKGRPKCFISIIMIFQKLMRNVLSKMEIYKIKINLSLNNEYYFITILFLI